jgi:hypothetical protein
MIMDRSLFRVEGGFAPGSTVICVRLTAIYGAGGKHSAHRAASLLLAVL